MAGAGAGRGALLLSSYLRRRLSSLRKSSSRRPSLHTPTTVSPTPTTSSPTASPSPSPPTSTVRVVLPRLTKGIEVPPFLLESGLPSTASASSATTATLTTSLCSIEASPHRSSTHTTSLLPRRSVIPLPHLGRDVIKEARLVVEALRGALRRRDRVQFTVIVGCCRHAACLCVLFLFGKASIGALEVVVALRDGAVRVVVEY